MREYNIDAHLMFVDFQKAFDTISHKSTWYTLVTKGIIKMTIETIKNLYDNAVAYMKLDKVGKEFRIRWGWEGIS